VYELGLQGLEGWLEVLLERMSSSNYTSWETSIILLPPREAYTRRYELRGFRRAFASSIHYETLRTRDAFENAFEFSRSRYDCSYRKEGTYGVWQCIRVIRAIVKVPFASRKKSKGSFADASFVVAFKLHMRLTRGLTLSQLRKDARARRRSPSTLPRTKVHNVYSCWTRLLIFAMYLDKSVEGGRKLVGSS